MMTVGKYMTKGSMFLLCMFAVAGIANAQGKEEYQQWTAKDKPGDGVATVVLPDGNTPGACRLDISLKGGPDCSYVKCKGEQPVFTQSAQSMMAAKQIALSVAKAHYIHFLQEEIKSKRATDMINAAIQNEGGPNGGTQESNGYAMSSSIREQASAIISGFAVVEDGFETIDNKKIAYVIGGSSCISQKAANNLSSGNRRDNSTQPSNTGGGRQNESGSGPAPTRRSAGNDQM